MKNTGLVKIFIFHYEYLYSIKKMYQFIKKEFYESRK
jgi:hypothetical protein